MEWDGRTDKTNLKGPVKNKFFFPSEKKIHFSGPLKINLRNLAITNFFENSFCCYFLVSENGFREFHVAQPLWSTKTAQNLTS
jgi:hypothetical protein